MTASAARHGAALAISALLVLGGVALILASGGFLG